MPLDLPSIVLTASVAAAVIGAVVTMFKRAWPAQVFDERAVALSWVLGPLIMLIGYVLDITGGIEDWHTAVLVGLQASILANGGYAAVQTALNRFAAPKPTPPVVVVPRPVIIIPPTAPPAPPEA